MIKKEKYEIYSGSFKIDDLINKLNKTKDALVEKQCFDINVQTLGSCEDGYYCCLTLSISFCHKLKSKDILEINNLLDKIWTK